MPISQIGTNSIASGTTLAAPTFSGTSTFSGGVANAYGFGVGTAVPSSGTGIAFPATQNPSSDANTLDDYEEGTWTPRVFKNNVEITSPTLASGNYIKIGKALYLALYFYKSSGSGTAGGNWTIQGLPYNVETNTYATVYAAIPGGYCEINAAQISGVPRWQPASGTALVLYNGATSVTTDWTTSFIEFAAFGVLQATA